MTSFPWEEKDLEIVRYLLGLLPSQEEAALEERYFCDPALLEQIDLVEDHLIREYLDDLLPGEFLDAFKRKYLADPELSRRVEFARDLRNALRSGGPESEAPFPSSGRAMFPSAWKLVILAASVAALGVLSVLIVQNKQLRTQVALLSAARLSVGDADSSFRAIGPPRILAIILDPGLDKGPASAAIRRLVLERGTEEIRIDFELPGVRRELSVAVDLVIVEPSGRRTLLTRTGVSTMPTSTGRTVHMAFARGELIPGDYIAFVREQDSKKRDATLESYSFSLVE